MKQMTLKEKFNSKFGIKKVEEVKVWIFDETSFDLHLEGGPTQTEMIKLDATLNSGEHKGNELILDCKWFNKTDNDIKEIVGVTGQSYQPCLLDAGTTIHIQCMPNLPGKQYEGMPIIKEIGPLSIDKETEDQARELIQAKQATFFINIQSGKLDKQELKPSEGILRLIGNKLCFQTKNSQDVRSELKSIEITDSYPNYIFNRVNTKELKVQLSSTEYIIISVLNHMSRDVIGLTTKMMAASKLVQQLNFEEEVTATSLNAPPSPVKKLNSARDLLQISDFTKQNRQLQHDKQQIEKKYFYEKDEKQKAIDKLKEVEERLINLNTNYLTIEQELKGIKEEKVRWEHHHTYLQNQIKIARAQCQHFSGELEIKNSELAFNIDKVNKFESQQLKKPYDQLQKEYEQLIQQNQRYLAMISYMTSQKQQLQETNQTQSSRLQHLSEEIMYLQKRHALLASQKIQQLKTTDHSHLLKEYEDREKNRQRQLLKLQDQVRQLVSENNLLRIHSPVAKKLDKNPKKAQYLEVQKVANRLAEAITEKDIVNEQLRNVNKKMIERIDILQRKVLELEEQKYRVAS